MRKHSIFLSLLALAWLMPFGAKAQTELQVAFPWSASDSTSYVPINPLYTDHGFYSECLYLEDDLTEMVGGTIQSITFYAATGHSTYQPNTTQYGQITFYLATTEATAETSSFLTTAATRTEVYSGTVSAVGNEYTIEFDDPYLYEGGNLVVCAYAAGCGSYLNTTYFRCQSTTEYASCYAYSSYGSSYTIPTSGGSTLRKRPTMTFTYSNGSGTLCLRPGAVTVSDVTTDGATFGWTPRGNESQWRVYIDGTEASDSPVSTSTYTATGLSAASNHTFAVKAICGDDNESNLASATFRTLCDVVTLPWSEDFESYNAGSGNRAECWATLQTYSTYPYVSTSYYHTGSKGYYLYSNNSSQPNFIATPKINAAPNTVHVVFWARRGSTSPRLEAGIMTDTSDLSSFIPLLNITGGSSSTWEEFEFFTDTITATGSTCYVAFRWTEGYGYGCYLDDIQVEVANDCRRPVDPIISAITYEGANISWTDNGGGADGYVVRVAKTNSITAPTAADYQASSNLYTLTGLDGNTTYYAWVRSVCGNDSTMWRYCGSFTTQRDCYNITSLTVADKNMTSALVTWAYQDGYGREYDGVELKLVDLANTSDTITENVTGNSHFLTGLEPAHNYRVIARTTCGEYSATETTVTFETPSCGQMRGTSTTTYAPTYNGYSARNSYTQSVYPASLLAGLDEITALQWRISSTPSGGMNRAVKVWLGTTDTLALDSTVAHLISTEQMTLVYDGNLNVATSGWTTINFTQPWNYDGTSNVVVAVLCNSKETSAVTWYATSSTTGSTQYWYTSSSTVDIDPEANLGTASWSRSSYLPDITFVGDCETPDCAAPLATYTSTTESSVSLAWIAGGGESSYTVQYRTYGANQWQQYLASTSSTSCTVNDLDNSSAYQFRVGSLCSDGDTLWAPIITARTQCGTMALPYTEGFEGFAGSNPFPTCWYKTQSYGSHPYISNSASYRHSGTAAMYSYTSSTNPVIFASPEVPADANNIKVTFWAYSFYTNSTNTQAGVVTDPSNPSSFIPCTVVATGVTQNSMTEYEFYTDNVVATGHVHVAFRIASSSGVYIDDVTIAEAGNCRRPNTPSVNSISYYSAMLHWNDVNHGTVTYQVCYNTENNLQGAMLYPTTTTGDSLLLSGLQNGQSYYAWVRQACSNDEADWLPMPRFTTEISCYQITGAKIMGRSSTTVAIGWDYNYSQGMSPQGVTINVMRNSDSVMVTTDAYTTGTGYVLTGLSTGEVYTVYLSTVCDPDTAAAVRLQAAPRSSVALDECSEYVGPNTTYNSNNCAPYARYYKYSICEMLYLASEVGNLDTITGLAFASQNDYGSQPVVLDVYLAHTTQTSLASTAPIQASDMVLVASGVQYDPDGTEFTPIPFDTPFEYDNTKNLVVVVLNQTGTYYASGELWKSYSVSGRCIYTQQDNAPYSVTNLPSFSVNSYLPATKFYGNCGSSSGSGEPCFAPSLVITDKGTDNVTLLWGADDNSATLTIQYRIVGETEWEETSALASAAPYLLSGLQHSSNYEFQVGIDCGDTVIYSNVVSCFTDCAAMSAPETFTFTTSLSNCWKLSNSNVSVSTYSNALYFSYAAQVGRAVLPEFSDNITTLKAVFHARTTSTQESMIVGVCNADGGNITWIDTIPVNGTYTNYTVYFDEYTGSENHIVVSKLGGYTYLYIDTINVEIAESCREVNNVAVSSITETTAVVTWHHPSATSFEVNYRAAGATTWQTATVNAETYTISGLNSNTGYQVRVRANCSSIDQSSWTSVVSFRTECTEYASLPYDEDFESYTPDAEEAPSCWSYVQVTSTYGDEPMVIAPGTSSDYCPTTGHSGSNYLYGYTYGYYSASQVVFATEMFAVPANTLSGSVWVSALGEYEDDEYYYYNDYYPARVEIGVMTDPSNTSTFVTIFDTTMESTEWVEINFSAATCGITEQAAIAFRFNTTSNDANILDYSIDDLHIETSGSVTPQECNAPVIASLTATENTATVVFAGAATSYEVGIVQGNTWNASSVTPISVNTHTFTGLSANTTYTVGVRAVCGQQTSTWATQTVTTLGHIATDCASPTALTVTDITTNSAVVRWQAGGQETAWKVRLGDQVLDATTTSYSLTGLAAATNYTVSVSAVCAEGESAPATAMFTTEMSTDGIDDIWSQSISLYPNPASSTVTIALGTNDAVKVTLVDQSGRMAGEWSTANGSLTIDVSRLAKGAYFVRIVGEQATAVRKLIVK